MSGHGFPTIENCIKCVLRDHRLFCNLPNEALIALQAIKATAVYPKGSMLCLEGQPARGVFILCTGRAKLSTTSAEGKSIILRIADPGEVLGLSAVVSNGTYEATVETLEPTQANFISQAQFVQYLQQYPEVGMKVAQQLTHNCKCAYSEIRALGLSNSVPEKIAKLLLTWAKQPLNMPGIKNEIPIRVTLTQEEIAQFVGTSRESVSRTLSEFKKKGWLRTKGATWWIVEKQHLERLVTT
jgi:CRP/FNR family transcriptional regulator, cyclic AMP receptor protein